MWFVPLSSPQQILCCSVFALQVKAA